MIRPLPGYVLIEPLDDEEVTSSGLALPEKAKEKPAKGKLLAIGKESFIENLYPSGVPTPTKFYRVIDEIRIGDIVIFNRWSGQDIKDGQKEYKLVKFSDLMGIYGDA